MQEFFKLTADNEIPVSAVNSKYSQVIFCQPAHLFDPDVEVLGCFIDGKHIFFVYRNFLICHDSCLLSLSFYQYSPSWKLFFRPKTKKRPADSSKRTCRPPAVILLYIAFFLSPVMELLEHDLQLVRNWQSQMSGILQKRNTLVG